MNTSIAETPPRAKKVVIGGDDLTVELIDGRRINVPLARYSRLLAATPEDRRCWRLLGDGEGIH